MIFDVKTLYHICFKLVNGYNYLKVNRSPKGFVLKQNYDVFIANAHANVPSISVRGEIRVYIAFIGTKPSFPSYFNYRM